MLVRLYNSYISLIVFIGLVLIVPYHHSFFSFKIADIWLLLCLFLQHVNGHGKKVEFAGRTFIKNFGLWMGIIAVISTLFQAWQDESGFSSEFLGEFLRFFRYLILFKFVENIASEFTAKDLHRFFNAYTTLGLLVMVLSIIEYYSIPPFDQAITNCYKTAELFPEQTLEESSDEVFRLAGILGNANTTGIFLTSTLVFPLISLFLHTSCLLNRLLLIGYTLAASYILIGLTSSRTSIIISILLFIGVVLLSAVKKSNLPRLFFVAFLVLGAGLYSYDQYGGKMVISERVTFLFEGKNSTGDKVGFIESMGRNELWNERYNTFLHHAHVLAFLTGMGYTTAYPTFSDNGLLSSFFNTGLIGLVLRLVLYFFIFRYCLLLPVKSYLKRKHSYASIVSGFVSIAFALWEITAEMIEHIKIGQVFYLFLSLTVVYQFSRGAIRKTKVVALANTAISLQNS